MKQSVKGNEKRPLQPLSVPCCIHYYFLARLLLLVEVICPFLPCFGPPLNQSPFDRRTTSSTTRNVQLGFWRTALQHVCGTCLCCNPTDSLSTSTRQLATVFQFSCVLTLTTTDFILTPCSLLPTSHSFCLSPASAAVHSCGVSGGQWAVLLQLCLSLFSVSSFAISAPSMANVKLRQSSQVHSHTVMTLEAHTSIHPWYL